jgi:hypothetical protein
MTADRPLSDNHLGLSIIIAAVTTCSPTINIILQYTGDINSLG